MWILAENGRGQGRVEELGAKSRIFLMRSGIRVDLKVNVYTVRFTTSGAE